MSEYQYYKFQTIDRPLNAEQQAAMRRLSKRVELTATRAAVPTTAPRRTFADLKEAAKHQQQRRITRERAEAERARLAKLEALAAKESQVWLQVEQLLAKRSASGYDEAVVHLATLRCSYLHMCAILSTGDGSSCRYTAWLPHRSAVRPISSPSWLPRTIRRSSTKPWCPQTM